MTWETLEKGAEELTNMYPRFEEIGDYCEGNFRGFITDDYGNKRIELWKGVDNEGKDIIQHLPSASDLRKYYNKLHLGDYVKITFAKTIPSNSEKYSDKKIFKVEVDHDKDVEFIVGEEDE